jgi:hypothetical protein
VRISAFGTVARSPSDPQMPLKPRPSVAGSFSSPRTARKIRFGVSAKTPGCDPQMYPSFAHGFGQPASTS